MNALADMAKQQFGARETDAEHELKISKYINEMDDELKDRFKALQAIQSFTREMDEEEAKDIRKLETEYENKYKEIYVLREALINGKSDLDQALIEEFDKRATEMKDEDYDKLEIVPCDVKTIQNIPKGVTDFWIKAMVNHSLGSEIHEKDRPILGYLQNIEIDLHAEGNGYDLIFTFLPNNYFKNTEIKKSCFMKDKGMMDSTTSTKIDWKDACNPTVKKQKKKKKGKKVNVEVQCESFFNFFNDLVPNKDEKMGSADKDGGDDDKEEDEFDDYLDELNNKLYDNLQMADQFKDDLVPLALEYYLGVIEAETPEEDDDDSDDDMDGGKKGGDDDSDEDGGKKKKKKGKKPVEMPLGPDGKPQECKQQ